MAGGALHATPTVELTPYQLRVVGDYCHRMAGRLERTE